MQFLEQQLNKVDALAAEVIPARRGSGYDESMEDLLTRDPGAVATASGVQALGLRLGLGSNRDGHQVKGGYEPEDVLDETSDPVVRAQRGKLAALVAALVVLEEKARTAKAARDGSITAATEAETVRAREAADAKEQHVALQRDIESETQELTQVATEAARRERDALGGDEGDFHDALLRATALAANRNEDARGMEKRAAELSAEAKVLEEACLSAALDEKETQKASAETSTSTSKTLLRRAETARLRLEVSAATQDLATLLGEETVRRAARSSQAVSSSHRTRKHTEETTADLQKSAESLAAQLLSRRLETQTLAREKLALEQAVAEALMERRRVTREHSVASDSGSAVSGGGLKRRAPGESERPLKASARKGGPAGVRQRVASAARRVDKIGIRAGRHLSRSGGWRSLALLYALGLHVFAFCVLASRALSAGPELKPIER